MDVSFMLRQRVATLEEALASIASDVAARSRLLATTKAAVLEHYLRRKNDLHELARCGWSNHDSTVGRLSLLEQVLDSLTHESRQVSIEAWRDIAALRREARTWRKQKSDAELRLRMMR